MNEKMVRFLVSIGIHDVDFFSDLSFEVANWDSPAHRVFYMTIRKNNPWDSELLDEFKSALENITYKYELRFSYVNTPKLEDVKNLFDSWQFERFIFGSEFFIEQKDEQTLVLGTSSPTTTEDELKDAAKDFGAYLKWLSYPFFLEYDIKLTPRSTKIPNTIIEELTPVEEPTPMVEETPVVEQAAPVVEETKAPEDVDEDAIKEPWEDDEEAQRQKELQEAEMRLLEEQMANQSSRESDRKFAKRGNYQQLSNIAEVFQLSGGNIEVEGTVFEPDFRVGKKGTMWGKFGLGDDVSAIYVRASESKNGLSAEKIKSIVPGMRLKVRGSYELDQRTSAIQIYCHYIDELPAKPLRDDPEPEKRVELHLHTKMSAMDAPGDIHAYGKLAKNMGMKAIAVTDHGVIQGFPEAERMAKATGLKVLYGCEFYMFDHPRLAWNPVDTPLLKAKYCVFDFETTGLSSRYDHVTEFGGVIVENGMVIDTLDILINPGVHIPEIIQQKTHITDEMVKNGPSEIEAAKRIAAFAKDAIFVSHNAAFDIGFLNKINQMAGLGKVKNPVIDTLAISRFLFPEARAHRLGNLSKNLGLEIYDDNQAHRADYDADVLNSVWQVVIGRLTEHNKDLTQKDLTTMKSSDHNFFKHLRSNHIVAIAKNEEGLKALYRLISKSHTKYLANADVPKILRDELVLERENLLLGSACSNGEIWEIATRNSEEDLLEAVTFYDYVEVQPKENYSNLVNRKVFTKDEIIRGIRDIVDAADEKGVMVCATGDCHYVNPEDKILRDIYINMKGLGGRNHPLKVFTHGDERTPEAPDQHFRSTREMLESFQVIFDEEKCKEIVITNTNKIADMVGEFPILKDHLYGPQANLPDSDVRIKEVCYGNLYSKYGPNPEPSIVARLDKELEGIIGNGYGVTYYIAHMIIKKANEDGYMVGSRGSVGSSFAATMGGITEVNPLAPHYLCNKCKHFEWSTDPDIKSGFDLPEKKCPVCGEIMEADGQNIPFETFLGFKAEKVPDIDLNFPSDYQSKAHAYARELLSTKEENEALARGETLEAPHVIRAGTISCAESKNVYGFARAYFREVLHRDDDEQDKAMITYIASRATGVKRTTGQHPGGIVVIPADMDIFDFTPFQHPADDLTADWLTTHYEFASMHDCLLKLDLLGHVDPMALRMMALRTGVTITDIPVNDPQVLSLFSKTDALGLKSNPLKFETGAMALPEFGTTFVQGLISEVRPKKFNDLLIVSGLSHGTDVWNNNAEDYFLSGTATLGEVIGCRDDIMTYLISKGVDSSRAFKFMEYVRKNKNGKPLKDDDVTALRAANVPEWYIDSCRKIKYLFPRAHATAYVMGSCRVGWFKIYRPLVFYAVYFTTRIDKFNIGVMSSGLDGVVAEINRLNSIRNSPEFKDTDAEILKGLLAAAELWDRGFKVSNIDLYKSLASEWVVDEENSAIIPPFSVISGLGANAAQSVVDARPEGEFISVDDLRDRTHLTETDIGNLRSLGVLDGMGESNQLSLFDFM